MKLCKRGKFLHGRGDIIIDVYDVVDNTAKTVTILKCGDRFFWEKSKHISEHCTCLHETQKKHLYFNVTQNFYELGNSL